MPDGQAELAGAVREMWAGITRAVEKVGENIAELNSTVGRLDGRLAELVERSGAREVTDRGVLAEFRRLVWMQDRARTSLHMLNRHAEAWNDPEGSPTIGMTGGERGVEIAEEDRGDQSVKRSGDGLEEETMMEE